MPGPLPGPNTLCPPSWHLLNPLSASSLTDRFGSAPIGTASSAAASNFIRSAAISKTTLCVGRLIWKIRRHVNNVPKAAHARPLQDVTLELDANVYGAEPHAWRITVRRPARRGRACPAPTASVHRGGIFQIRRQQAAWRSDLAAQLLGPHHPRRRRTSSDPRLYRRQPSALAG
jgi:hypothetical protein